MWRESAALLRRSDTAKQRVLLTASGIVVDGQGLRELSRFFTDCPQSGDKRKLAGNAAEPQ